MKRSLKSIIFILAALGGIFLLAACAEGQEPPPQKAYTLSAEECSLVRFEDVLLTLCDEDGSAVPGAVWKSENPAVASVDGGKVVAMAEGTATVIAEYEEKSYPCTVTVSDAGMVPSVVVGRDVYSLGAGESAPLETKVSFNGRFYDDAVFGYTVSDETVCSIEGGAVTALHTGTAEVVVTASWRGADALDLTAAFTVQVKEDANLQIEQKQIPLSTASLEIGGEKFVSEAQADAVLTVGGEIQGSPALEWYTSDNQLFTVNGEGIVRVSGTGKTGTAYLWAEAAVGTFTVCSDKVPVTVSYPIIDRSSDIQLLFDLSEGMAPLDPQTIFGDTSTITKVTEGDAGENIWSENAVDLSAVEYGEKQFTVYNAVYAVRISAVCATQILRQADDFHIFDNRAGTILNGYYILDSDIDASGYIPKINSWVSNNDGGFGGIFDGRGFNIDNMTISTCGLFGAITSTGVVKNVSFTNVTLTGVVASVFAGSSWGTVENVFVHVKDTSAALNDGGVLFDTMKGGNIRNIVVYVAPEAAANGYFMNNFAGAAENVYVVADCFLLKRGQSDDIAGATRYAEISPDNDYGTAFGQGWQRVNGLPVPDAAVAVMQTILSGGTL